MSAKEGGLQVTIPREEDTSGQVAIPLGTSKTIDLNMPITRLAVANPEIASVVTLSPRRLLLASEAVGITQLILWTEDEARLVIGVIVEPNLSQLKTMIERMVPDADVEVRAVNDAVILGGRVSRVEDADRIVGLARLVSKNVHNQITTSGEQQVLLRCTVAEVRKSAIRSLGVDSWASFKDNSPRITADELVTRTSPIIDPIFGAPAGAGTAMYGNRFLFGGNPGGFHIAQSSQSLQMELFVRAMQENGLLRVLAEPNLIALSGQKAEFLAGGQFPVPVPQANSNGNTITIEWKNYGVMLQFVPTVIGQQKVRLTVAPEISEIDFSSAVQIGGFVVPGVVQRRANTTIELACGSTIALAGLLSESVRGNVQKVPGLGNLPVIGALFRSVEYQRDLSELVILVTPEMATGMAPDQVPPLPGQNLEHPNDWELYALGRIDGDPVEPEPTRAAALRTDIPLRLHKYTSPPEQMSVHGPWGPAEAAESAE